MVPPLLSSFEEAGNESARIINPGEEAGVDALEETSADAVPVLRGEMECDERTVSSLEAAPAEAAVVFVARAVSTEGTLWKWSPGASISAAREAMLRRCC